MKVLSLQNSEINCHCESINIYYQKVGIDNYIYYVKT